MKRITFIALVVSLCGCYGKKPKTITGLEGKPMPTITLLAADSSTMYNTADIAPGKPTLLFSFETWCPYCKAQTKALLSHIESLKDVNIYMVCNTQFPEFKKFNKQYELYKYPGIKAGVDNHLSFAKYFKTGQIPYLAIYDRQKNLKQVLVGKTAISTIKDIALE
jgi:thiol-disulfide isomerase/thioredoxin